MSDQNLPQNLEYLFNLIDDQADGERPLTESESAELAAALKTYPVLRQYAEQTQDMVAGLKGLPKEAAPTGLTDKVMARLDAEAPTVKRKQNVVSLFKAASSAAAVMLLVAGTVWLAKPVREQAVPQVAVVAPAAVSVEQIQPVSSVAEPTQESDTQATSTVDTHVDSEMNLLVAAVDVDAAQARNLRQDVPVMTIQDSLVLPENPEIADASMADTAGMDADMLADEDPMLNLVGF